MEWYHVCGMILGNLAILLPLWIWVRAESRADARHMDAKIDSNRELIHVIHKETMQVINEIKLESRDFHHRLLEIERARKT